MDHIHRNDKGHSTGAGIRSNPVLSDTAEKLELFQFEPGDSSDPLNWPKSRKIMIVIGIYLTTFTVSLSSSAFSAAVPVSAARFDVSPEVMTLAISLYVLGFAAGPLLWAPLSEAYGRRYPYIISYFLFTVFQVAIAVGQNPATILVCRFICGACGSSTFSVSPAMLVDFLEPVVRNKVVGLYMVSTTIQSLDLACYTYLN